MVWRVVLPGCASASKCDWVRMSWRSGIADLYEWWSQTLVGLLPRRVRGGDDPPSLHIRVQRRLIELSPHEGSRVAFQPVVLEGADGLAESLLATKISSNNMRVCLVLDDDRFIKRSLSTLALPNSTQEKMTKLDLAASTPFAEKEVLLIQGRESSQVDGTSYFVVKKEIIEPVLTAIGKTGFMLDTLVFGADEISGGSPSLMRLKDVGFVERVAGRMVPVGVLACMFGLAFTVAHVHWRHAQANGVLDEQISIASQNAATTRRLIAERNEALAQLVALRQEKKDVVPVVVIIEELSRIIPDGTWITDLEINSGIVRLSGFSKDAPKLIPLLDASELFVDPTFRSPVLKVNVQVGDRFSLLMKVEQQNDG